MGKRRHKKSSGFSFLRIAIIGGILLVYGLACLISEGGLPGSDPATIDHTNNNVREIEIPDWIQQKFLSIDEYTRSGRGLDTVDGIVVHYVANPGSTGWENWHYFEGLAQSHETKASTHFIIGLDGTIIQCIPLGEMSYCSNDRNWDTIAIECCHPDEDGKFTDATYSSLVRLCRWLMEEYDLSPEEVIRHYDVTGKLCPLYYVDHEDAWDKFHKKLR